MVDPLGPLEEVRLVRRPAMVIATTCPFQNSVALTTESVASPLRLESNRFRGPHGAIRRRSESHPCQLSGIGTEKRRVRRKDIHVTQTPGTKSQERPMHEGRNRLTGRRVRCRRSRCPSSGSGSAWVHSRRTQ